MLIYFTLQDKENLSSVGDNKLSVISPEEINFRVHDKIDSILKEIYTELYNRSFSINGLDIEFSAGLGKDYNIPYTVKLSSIKHEEFILNFSGKFDNATFHYPEREIHFYSDDSTTSLITYVGDNWEKDKERFFKGGKIHSKMDGKDRYYLKYKAERGSDSFIPDTDLGREYSPEGNEPISIKKETEFNRLKNFLLGFLDELKELPSGEFDPSVFDYSKKELDQPIDLKIFSESYNYDYAEKMIVGPNTRLVSIGSFPKGLEYDERYVDGYAYGELNVGQDEPTYSWRHAPRSRENRYECDIELKYSDNVFVIDMEPVENIIESFKGGSKFNVFGDAANPEELTEEERNRKYYATLVSTFVRLDEYDGSYKKPLYLINRRMYKDEVKSIKKCEVKRTPINKKALDELLDL